ncbi:hypothetical protein IG631_22639 [Alternaria alternata]|nr:hypothetical protein IG631_22639 [Alternaria alternata]
MHRHNSTSRNRPHAAHRPQVVTTISYAGPQQFPCSLAQAIMLQQSSGGSATSVHTVSKQIHVLRGADRRFASPVLGLRYHGRPHGETAIRTPGRDPTEGSAERSALSSFHCDWMTRRFVSSKAVFSPLS